MLVNVNPAYRVHELEDALAMADVATLVVGSPFKGSNFVAMVESLCPEVATANGRDWSAARFPRLKRLIALGDRPGPGWWTWADLEDGPQAPESDLASRARAAAGQRRPQHPVHLGNDRPAQGGDADASQCAHERVLHRRAAALFGSRQGLRAGAVLPLLRVRAGQPGLRRLRIGDRGAGASFDAGATLACDRRRALHGGLRRADHVRGAARASRFRSLRPDEPAHRHHVGRSLSACR